MKIEPAPPRGSRQRGVTLVEILVASAILMVAILVCLVVYEAARNAVKSGDNATEQQEAVRTAFDRTTSDLRMLGFNCNPDGNPARPDEALEVALDHAIVFRADFDADDPILRNDHESALAGGAFGVVATGNDEIVGYVLAAPDGTGPDTIVFQADVDDEPRDGAVSDITVDNVVTNPINPPYTLYKIALNNNVATCCGRNFVVRIPVVENIRNVTFRYYNGAAATAEIAPGAAETAAAKARRAAIRRVNVSLIGMTRDPDMSYVDIADDVARHYRKFELCSDVLPRNAGMKGIEDAAPESAFPSTEPTP